MATYDYSVTGSWTSVQAGAKTLNVCNTGYESNGLESLAEVFYRVAGSAPSDSAEGVRLSPYETHPVEVPTGENLYMRHKRGTGLTQVVTAVDGA